MRPGLTATVLISTDAVGGVWRYTMEVSRGLAARGWTVLVAVLGPAPHPTQLREAEAIAGIEIIVTGLALDWLAETPAALAAAAAALASEAARAHVALLHTPGLIGVVPWPVPVAVMMHSCLTTWFAAVRGTPVAPDYAWRADAAADGLRRASVLAAPTQAFAEAIAMTYGLPPLMPIHNGRDPVALPPAYRQASVLTAGRLWDDAKNIPLLDQVAARLPFPVRAAGSVNNPSGTGVGTEALELLGSLDEAGMGEALATATVFASPARYEPFGLAVLEAAQAGLALVLSDIPTFRELWDGAAYFVPADNVDDWEAALLEVLENPEPWAAAAQAQAARYTAAAMVEGTVALLTHAMKAAVPA